MQETPRQRRPYVSGMRLCAALSAAAIAVTTAGLAPATATIGPGGVPAGRNITVFHNIDFVAVFGWPIGVDITVSVVDASGLTIGTATGPSVLTPDGPGLEVNHGPEGPPQRGDCWIGGTPDIKPGHTIVVSQAGRLPSSVIVDDITFSGPATLSATGNVEVRGVAKFANGTNIPVGRLDSGEFRDVLPNGQYRANPDQTIAEGVDGGFVMVYAPPYNGFRQPADSTEAQRQASLLNSGGHAIGFGHVAPLPSEAMLVDGIADAPGPALGCEGFIQPPPTPAATRPARPGSIRATAGNRAAAVSWTRSAVDGNATITGYRLRVFRRATLARTINLGNVNRTTVRRLVNGARYRFDVRAINRVGASVASPRSNVVVPRR